MLGHLIHRKTAKVIMHLLAISFMAILAGCSSKSELIPSDTSIPSEFHKILDLLNNIKGYRAPYLGGYSMDNKQVILHSHNSPKALIWNVNLTGNTQVIDRQTLPQELVYSSFAKGQLNNIDSVFVMQEDDAITTFSLAIHEAYHFYGQDFLSNLDLDHDDFTRGFLYPENIEPRYLIRAADKRLREKMDGSNQRGALFLPTSYQKIFRRHSGWPSNITGRRLSQLYRETVFGGGQKPKYKTQQGCRGQDCISGK